MHIRFALNISILLWLFIEMVELRPVWSGMLITPISLYHHSDLEENSCLFCLTEATYKTREHGNIAMVLVISREVIVSYLVQYSCLVCFPQGLLPFRCSYCCHCAIQMCL